ncbi:MAG TPA: DUF4331 domain-containing protein [Acidimicrobiales bacterium]|jgi:hypothetical protein
MSSHREAPSISKDPVADNTDTYAFVTPNNTVAIITSYLPSQAPAGGPNFYEFGDDVTYQVNIDNNGDGRADVIYQFKFTTVNTNPNTFLYNTGPIDSLTSANWNRRQTYTVTKITRQGDVRLARNLACPPCNIGPRSTPNYSDLADAATYSLDSGEKVFAGQRADSFFVDLGSVFDLGTLRPFQNLHLIPTAAADGRDSLAQANVHSIVLEVPIEQLVRGRGAPTDPMAANATIGVWGSAYRQKANVRGASRRTVGPWMQVSRLGNPLFNEVIVPLAQKDQWNADSPNRDSRYAQFVAQPELARLLPVLYPGVFPNLAGLTADRADLLAILLTGIPSGIIPGFQNFTGTTQADMLRLNVAIPPSSSPSRLGLIGGDLAGFPNGRRLTDDAVTIELRAVAGATYPLVAPTYTPDDAVSVIEDGTFNNPGRNLLNRFPYIGLPYAGYDVP